MANSLTRLISPTAWPDSKGWCSARPNSRNRTAGRTVASRPHRAYAGRGERTIALLPQEFRLLRYMMQHNGQLLKRSTLLEDVWHYKFIPKTNLVDVHMGRLRHKVNGPNEAPMIHNIRGAGFILRVPS